MSLVLIDTANLITTTSIDADGNETTTVNYDNLEEEAILTIEVEEETANAISIRIYKNGEPTNWVEWVPKSLIGKGVKYEKFKNTGKRN